MDAVFGANGFLGRRVVAGLAARGRAVRAVSRRFDADFGAAVGLGTPGAGRIETLVADMRDPFASLAALQGTTRVLQLVSSSSPALQNDYAEADILENVLPQMRFARDCLAAGVGRLVFVSSGGAVYGPPRYLPIDEAHPTDPLNSHGLTKLMTEKYLGMLAATRGLDVAILRVANPFGPTQGFRKGQGLIPAVLARHRAGEPVPVYGDGSARRDYVYVEDVVEAIIAAMDVPATRLAAGDDGTDAPSAGEQTNAPSARELITAPSARESINAPSARELVNVPSARELVNVPSARELVNVPSARELVNVPSARCGVFNIGSGEARSVNEVLAAIEARLGEPIARSYLPARDTDVAVSLLAIGRARRLLGWSPRTSFEAAMDATLAGHGGRTGA